MSRLPQLPHVNINILLADDDQDDCLLFQDALAEVPMTTNLDTVRNGDHLMQFLHAAEQLPKMIFLDLNMPRKNGYECLAEIRQTEKLWQLPVIIMSTSFNPDIINMLYHGGAQHYICKPNAYEHLVKVIFRAISITFQGNSSQPPREEFVLSPESFYGPLANAAKSVHDRY